MAKKTPPQSGAPGARKSDRNDNWRRYWVDMIGVKDQKQLARIRQYEAAHSSRNRQRQSEVKELRRQLQLGASEGTLSSRQSDSLLVEITRRLLDIEKMGLEFWRRVDSVLTPEQRNTRVARLKASSPDILQERVSPEPHGPVDDTVR